jgi:hypothetical protein
MLTYYLYQISFSCDPHGIILYLKGGILVNRMLNKNVYFWCKRLGSPWSPVLQRVHLAFRMMCSDFASVICYVVIYFVRLRVVRYSFIVLNKFENDFGFVISLNPFIKILLTSCFYQRNCLLRWTTLYVYRYYIFFFLVSWSSFKCVYICMSFFFQIHMTIVQKTLYYQMIDVLLPNFILVFIHRQKKFLFLHFNLIMLDFQQFLENDVHWYM